MYAVVVDGRMGYGDDHVESLKFSVRMFHVSAQAKVAAIRVLRDARVAFDAYQTEYFEMWSGVSVTPVEWLRQVQWGERPQSKRSGRRRGLHGRCVS